MKMRTKLTLFLTAVTLMSASGAQAFENLLIPATNTFDSVKQDLWMDGVNLEISSGDQAQNLSSKSAQMPEEVTLGLEKWESSL